MSRAIKNSLASLLRRSGHASFLRRRIGGLGVIFLLHEIHDDDAFEFNTGGTVALLADLVGAIRRDGWEIVDLDEAMRRVTRGSATRPFAVLTFDDGYRDNLTRALPVLERMQAPFTIYVPTGAVTRELYAWWLGLRALFRRYDEVSVDCMGRRFACASAADKIAGFKEVSGWVHRNYCRDAELAPTFAAYDVSLSSLADDYFLNSDELRSLAHHPLVTIGAHTIAHKALSTLEPDGVRREMTGNKTFLEQLLGKPIDHFAYPYGDVRACGTREAEIAREVGFVSAVTASASPIFVRHRDQMHSLPRIGIGANETSQTLFYRASGLSWALNAHKHRQRASA